MSVKSALIPPASDTNDCRHLQHLLGRVPGIQTRLDLDPSPKLVVLRKQQPFATWTHDGHSLVGNFDCEGALLCAKTTQEAFDLTVGRSG